MLQKGTGTRDHSGCSGEVCGELSIVALSQDLFCERAKLPGVGSSGFLKYMAAFQPNELAFVLSFPHT